MAGDLWERGTMYSDCPEVTVLMATCNGEKFVAKQIDSILNQSYGKVALIISDDASNDGTLEILKGYAKRYENITLCQNETNLGYVKNFEALLERADTPYMAFSDQDDIWVENKLEIQMSEMRKAEAAYGKIPILVHSDLRMVDEKGVCLYPSYFRYRGYRLKKGKDLGHILGPCGVMGNTVLFNSVLKEKALPFPKGLEHHDYWIALVNELFGKRVTLQAPLVEYVIHEGNSSNSSGSLKHSTAPVETMRRLFGGELKPPYVTSRRYEVLAYLLENYRITDKEKGRIETFMGYLRHEQTKIAMAWSLIRYSLLKRDWRYRMKTVARILFGRWA